MAPPAAAREPSPRRLRALARAGLAALALAALGAGGALGDHREVLEDAHKAALVYQVAHFVRWPAGAADSPLLVCSLARESLSAALEARVTHHTVNGRPVVVERLTSVQDCARCDLLFVGAEQAGRDAEVLAATRGHPTLTVGESPDFARRGGMVGLVHDRQHLRFEINRRAVESSGLHVSSRLLGLATVVAPAAREED